MSKSRPNNVSKIPLGSKIPESVLRTLQSLRQQTDGLIAFFDVLDRDMTRDIMDTDFEPPNAIRRKHLQEAEAALAELIEQASIRLGDVRACIALDYAWEITPGPLDSICSHTDEDEAATEGGAANN